MLHKKFTEATGSRDEKQPLDGILSTAYYAAFLQKQEQIPAAFYESVWTYESLHLFPRKVSYYKKVTA